MATMDLPLSAATSGNAWAFAGLGIALATGVGGSNQFGNDFLFDDRPNELCAISGGLWSSGSLTLSQSSHL
jgi:hypothetical protein